MSTRWDPLRDSLIAADFHQVVPPDAFAEWEYINDRNTRVRFAPNRPVAAALALTHPLILIDECVRGERHLAVAAASILSRAVSLR